MTVPATDFQMSDLARSESPYDLVRELRALGPVVRSTSAWLVVGHAEVHEILRHPAARSGFVADVYRAALPPGAAREEFSHRVNFLDAPDHARVRRLVAKAFTPRRVDALRPFVAGLCRELLQPLAGSERIDLIEAYAHAVPSLVISQLLGVPTQDRELLTDLSDRVAGLLGLTDITAAEREDAVDAAEKMHAYLRALVSERRDVPRDDLLSALLRVDDHEALRESELLSLVATLYSAGHRTTRDLFSNGLATLLRHPKQLDRARTGQLPSAALVEEFLRYETPTHYVLRRLTRPAEIGGVRIPRDEPIVVMLAAANRDARVYPDADTFDPSRWLAAPGPPPPVSFAFGPHFCLGASLARMEVQGLLESLFEVFPGVARAEAPLVWWQRGPFRGLEALPVVLGPV